MKIKKFKFDIFFLVISVLILVIKFEFFLNIYIILKNNVHSRMISSYGYCYPLGYGFIKEAIKKKEIENLNIKTKNSLNIPNSNIFIYSFKNQKSQYEILINYELEKLNNIKKKFKIIYNKENCYLIKYTND
tara:strand:+ start:169 stop:564 length:396 start_codon:yes stop_codon:yes gene_type:complete